MNLFPVEEDGIIDIFGFKLHTDDLIIILILFILYKEDVKDKFLFIRVAPKSVVCNLSKCSSNAWFTFMEWVSPFCIGHST